MPRSRQDILSIRVGHRLFWTIVLTFLTAGSVGAGELSLLGGYNWKKEPVESAPAWQIHYQEGLGENFAYSLDYLNQGHFLINHRDCHAANLWLRTNLWERQLSLAAGLGGLYYYDTVLASGDNHPRVLHGWGTMTSLAATWYTRSPWFYQVQAYRLVADKSFSSLSLLAGVGYQLEAPATPGPEVAGVARTAGPTANELTFLAGGTTVNHPYSSHSYSGAIEYRRGLRRNLEGTVRALEEGRNNLTDRQGLAFQLWLAKPFLADRLALGAGFGGYLASDRRRSEFEPDRNSGFFLCKIASLTASFRLRDDWQARAIWDRVITGYNRDADVFLAGIGYRF